MERSQKNNNFFVRNDEFMRLEFTTNRSREMPGFILDFVDYLIGVDGILLKLLTQKLKASSPLKGGVNASLEEAELQSQMNYQSEDD